MNSTRHLALATLLAAGLLAGCGDDNDGGERATTPGTTTTAATTTTPPADGVITADGYEVRAPSGFSRTPQSAAFEIKFNPTSATNTTDVIGTQAAVPAAGRKLSEFFETVVAEDGQSGIEVTRLPAREVDGEPALGYRAKIPGVGVRTQYGVIRDENFHLVLAEATDDTADRVQTAVGELLDSWRWTAGR